MKYHVVHTTSYRYSQPAPLCHNLVHLTPRTFARQKCLYHELEIVPSPSFVESWYDYFGNGAHFFSLETPHTELIITARSELQVLPSDPFLPAATLPWEDARAHLQNPPGEETRAASQFCHESPFVPRSAEAEKFAAPLFLPGRPLLDAVLALTSHIFREFKFDKTATAVNTPTSEVFKKRRGVCQDFAHLQIACLRSLGLAARYVSGYLLTDPPPGKPKLVGADASHAWISVYCPGLGWIDYDPTNNLIPDIRHVTLGWGRDYGDVCPINGVLIGGGKSELSVSVDVAPVAEI